MAEELFGDGVDRAEADRLKAAMEQLGSMPQHVVMASASIVDHFAADRVQGFLDATVAGAFAAGVATGEIAVRLDTRTGRAVPLTFEDLRQLLFAHTMRGQEIRGLTTQLDAITQQRDIWARRVLGLLDELAAAVGADRSTAARTTVPRRGDQVTATFDLGNLEAGEPRTQTDTGTLLGWTEPMALVGLSDGRVLRARHVHPAGRGDADA